MTGLDSLWLPILLSSVLVFVVSSVIHVLTPWHKGDYPQLPEPYNNLAVIYAQQGDYEKARDALQAAGDRFIALWGQFTIAGVHCAGRGLGDRRRSGCRHLPNRGGAKPWEGDEEQDCRQRHGRPHGG